MIPSQTGGDGYAGDDWIAMLNEGEEMPEPSKNLDCSRLDCCCCMYFGCSIPCGKNASENLGEFRDSFDENGDIIEALDDEPLQKEERLDLKLGRKSDREADRIRRTYRRTIKKHYKEIPAPYETPTELEKNAGLSEDEGMKLLHVKYERVRYGQDKGL